MGLSRRSLLCGLIAAPAVICAGNLMPLRGVKFDPIVRLQSWPLGTERWGEWWVHEGKLSNSAKVAAEMRKQFGVCYSVAKDEFKPWVPAHPLDRPSEEAREYGSGGPRDQFGYRETLEERRARPLMSWANYSSESRLTPEAFNISTEILKTQLANVCQWGA